MASKHAKLKVALTRAIIDFFLQEDLYADELKIQGTLCVTADRSAIFVTQITETVVESGDHYKPDHSPTAPARVHDRGRLPSVPYYHRSTYEKDGICKRDQSAGSDIAEDLTCKQQRNVSNDQTSAADGSSKCVPPTKSVNHAVEPSSSHYGGDTVTPVNSTTPPTDTCTVSVPSHIGEQVEKYISNLAGRNILEHRSPCHSASQRRLSSSHGSSAIQQRLLASSDQTEDTSILNNVFLDAAARSAIERLTSMNRESVGGAEKLLQKQSSWMQPVLETHLETSGAMSNDLNSIVQDTLTKLRNIRERDGGTNAKRIRLDHNSSQLVPSVSENAVKSRLQSGICFRKTAESVAMTANRTPSTIEDDLQPLMLVNPKRERVSDEENEPDEHSSSSISIKGSPATGRGKGGRKSPLVGTSGSTDWPSGGEGQQSFVTMGLVPQVGGDGANAISTWSFGGTSQQLKEEHPTMSMSGKKMFYFHLNA